MIVLGRHWNRRITDALMNHAGHTMPGASREWARAMRNELAYVSDHGQALRWALGCVAAAYTARLRQLIESGVIVRAAAAALALFCAFDVTLPAALMTVHKLGALGHIGLLAGLVPGDDFGRLVPLAEAIPIWLHLLLAAAGGSYVAAAGSLLGRANAAPPLLVVGVGLGLASSVLERATLAPIGRVTPDPSLLSTMVLPVVLPLLAAIVTRPAHGKG